MLIDLSPLRRNRDYRLLFAGQMVSFFGSMMTYVAIPYQVYELTKSSWMVGMIGIAQLIPMASLGLLGGSFADSFDRKRLLLVSEALMGLAAAAFALNASLETPSVALIFVLAAVMQGVAAFHRPAMDALTQKIVDPEHYASIGALGSLRYSAGSILGPAAGGMLMAWGGAKVTYWIDAATFVFAFAMIALMRAVVVPEPKEQGHLNLIGQGLRYAWGRPELIGTYLVDIVAMTFAFPIALFPELAQAWGGASAAGMLFSAMSAGSLLMTLFSGWAPKVRRKGAAVVIAAAIWGVGIIGLGFAPDLTTASACLVLAGAADMVSGLFRGIIWNETIPNEMRGRMAGVEMISYMSGPLLGNARAGWMASITSVSTSLVLGGVLCTVGVAVCGVQLKGFWRYGHGPGPVDGRSRSG